MIVSRVFWNFYCFFLLKGVFATNNRAQIGTKWVWECQENTCSKVLAEQSKNGLELNTCRLICGKNSTLFPLPTGKTSIGQSVKYFQIDNLTLKSVLCGGKPCSPEISGYIKSTYETFKNNIGASVKNSFPQRNDAPTLHVAIDVRLYTEEIHLKLESDEAYSLTVNEVNSDLSITIEATNVFGARHAFETTSQLIDFSELYSCMQIVYPVSIVKDRPKYKYRGLTLDIARNFYSLNSLKRIIRGLSYNKMNILHLHLTDTQSFPVVIETVPKMSQYGAYDRSKTYSSSDIKELVSYGISNGVKVIPEFDQPAHCGEGWEWGPSENIGNLTVCFDSIPWQNFCSEPPCGQLNPVNPNLYKILFKIYKELINMFQTDIFHAGGDEINIKCWNSSQEIREWITQQYGDLSEENFFAMWSMFLQKSSDLLYEANNGEKLPLILWTSDMTSTKYLKYLDPKKYIIQLWTPSNGGDIAEIVTRGFKTIFSQYDKIYLDCGYGDWMRKGVNWCSPYKDWKSIYESDPLQVLKSLGVNVTEEIKGNVLGQEAAMWSETVDEHTVDGKVWPRLSALAERLWSNPTTSWEFAYSRLASHRERMVKRGINANPLQPEWCLQNDGKCLDTATIKHSIP